MGRTRGPPHPTTQWSHIHGWCSWLHALGGLPLINDQVGSGVARRFNEGLAEASILLLLRFLPRPGIFRTPGCSSHRESTLLHASLIMLAKKGLS